MPLSESGTHLQICPLYDKSEFFRALPFQQKVLDAVGRLIGEPIVLHLDGRATLGRLLIGMWLSSSLAFRAVVNGR